MNFTILLVEDSPADVRLCREALASCAQSHCLHVARDGEEALAFLQGQGIHALAPVPDLVLLDLNLPRMNGLEVLRAIRATETTRRIPVVAFTTSTHQADVDEFYEAGGNSYLIKPTDLEGYTGLVAQVAAWWERIAQRPSKHHYTLAPGNSA